MPANITADNQKKEKILTDYENSMNQIIRETIGVSARIHNKIDLNVYKNIKNQIRNPNE